VHSFVPNM